MKRIILRIGLIVLPVIAAAIIISSGVLPRSSQDTAPPETGIGDTETDFEISPADRESDRITDLDYCYFHIEEQAVLGDR
jgi:hypothetical protein